MIVCGRALGKNAMCRVLALVLALVNICVARWGNDGDPLSVPVNERFLVIITAGAYVIILTGMIGNYFRGQGTPDFMEYFFIGLGFVLFISGGACLVSHFHNYRSGHYRNAGLGLASTMLATGVTMGVDFALMVFNCR